MLRHGCDYKLLSKTFKVGYILYTLSLPHLMFTNITYAA